MNGSRNLLILTVMGLVAIIGLVVFPAWHDMLGDVSTTGFPTLLTTVITALPYIAVGVILYAVLSARSGK
jgi:hypothetical protein